MQIVKELIKKAFPGLVQSRNIKRLTAAEREIELLPLLCSKDKIAIDVGANLGLYSHYFDRLCKDVVAFEPIPVLQAHLKRQYPRIQIESVALSDAPGHAQLRMPTKNFSWATIAPSNALELANPEVGLTTIEVPLRTLDSYKFQNVGIIKIDVEGHEEAVLRGAPQLLLDSKPNVIIEIEERHNTGSVQSVADLMQQSGYEGFFLDNDKLEPISGFDKVRDQAIGNVGTGGKSGRYINNFVFIPAGGVNSIKQSWNGLSAR